MKKTLLCLLALTALLCSALCAAEQAELKYKFKKGAVEKYRETRSFVYEFAFLGSDEKAVTEKELELKETVQSVEDGNAIIKMETKFIKMTENGEEVPKSETPDEVFYYTLSPQGRTLSLLDSDKKPEKNFDPKKEKDLLPKGSVSPGDKWQGFWSCSTDLGVSFS